MTLFAAVLFPCVPTCAGTQTNPAILTIVVTRFIIIRILSNKSVCGSTFLHLSVISAAVESEQISTFPGLISSTYLSAHNIVTNSVVKTNT